MSKIVITDLNKSIAAASVNININATFEGGNVYGILGPNGAGKTSLIRQIVGLSIPSSGQIQIDDQLVTLKNSSFLKNIGYVSGEINLPLYMNAIDYLVLCAKMRGLEDLAVMNRLISYFELDSKFKIKKMSKGNRQKVAIISAFMHKPSILILDEPTSGLDPLMIEKFNQLILQAKESGCLVILSSHFFEEVQAVCDEILVLKDGMIKEIFSMSEIQNKNIYEVKITNQEQLEALSKNQYQYKKINNTLYEIDLEKKSVNEFLKLAVENNIINFSKKKIKLSEEFQEKYANYEKNITKIW